MATIAYADTLEHTPLPIDAQDIVTRARIVIAGVRAGRDPNILNVLSDDRGGSTGAFTHVSYLAAPIVHEGVDALDSAYHATRSFALPDGVAPFLDPTDTAIPEPTSYGMSNPGSPSAVRDGDGTTYAQNDGTGDTIELRYWTGVSPTVQFVGFKIKYAANTQASILPVTGFKGHIAVAMTIKRATALTSPIYTVTGYYGCEDAETNEFYALLPFDARGLAENQGSPSADDTLITEIDLYSLPGSLAAAGDLKVYEFYPLVLDTALLDGIAAQNLRLPASAPQRVTVRGYVAPDKTHTITGWPGGDYTGAVAKQTYGGGETIIDFEQKGAAGGTPQENAQVANYQAQSTRAKIATAAYPVTLGQRQ